MIHRPTLPPRAFPVTIMCGSALILLQCLIEPSMVNFVCSAITVAMAALTFGYCLRPTVLQRYPLSVTAVIGYNVTCMTLALVAQSFYLTPIIFNLQYPVTTFGLSAILQLVLLAAHVVYARATLLRQLQHTVSTRILTPMGLFRRPTILELWLLGLLGLAAIWYARIINVGDIEYGDAGGRFLQALRPFAAAPFMIPLRGAFSCTRIRPPSFATTAMLGVYFLALVITGITANARSIFATVVLIFLLAALMMVAMKRLTVKRRTRSTLLLGLLVAVPVLNVASDLSDAMVIARKSRGQVSLSGMITATAEAFNDKEALARAADNKMVLSGTEYSEFYIRNSFLQRLTYTKYTDIMFNASYRFSDRQLGIIREEFHQQLLSILPTPVLRLVGVQLDKSTTSHSAGDVYDNLAFGSDSAGFRVGSSIVNSRDVLGVWWIPGMFLISILSMWIIDLLAVRTRMGLVLSPLAFLSLSMWFTRGFVTDSLSQTIGIITRGTIQSILIYAMLSYLARLTGRILATPPPSASANRAFGQR